MSISGDGPKHPKVLLLSTRGVINWLASTAFYELEDLAREWMDADLLAPTFGLHDVRGYAAASVNSAVRLPALSGPILTRALGTETLKTDYDLLFTVLPTPRQVCLLSHFRNLREKCRKMVAYIPETWAHDLEKKAYLAKQLKDFDHIFVSTAHSPATVTELTGVPCSFLPFSVDADKFSPFPFFPERHIEVLSIGRRHPEDHTALLNAMEQDGIYYSYDTFLHAKFRVATEHRIHYANSAKRAKYYIANVANFDQPEKTRANIEIGHRFYEGAASGTVMLGACPTDNDVLNRDFDWNDAIIRTNDIPGTIYDLIKELNAQPERLEKARRTNVINSLLRHDYVYRWVQVLNAVGIPATDKMRARQARLREMAQSLAGQSDAAPAAPLASIA